MEWLAVRARRGPDAHPRAHVVARTNRREPMLAMALAGVGLACLPTRLGRPAGLRELPGWRDLPRPSLWLGVHREVRTIPRVRAVTAFLAGVLRDRAS